MVGQNVKPVEGKRPSSIPYRSLIQRTAKPSPPIRSTWYHSSRLLFCGPICIYYYPGVVFTRKEHAVGRGGGLLFPPTKESDFPVRYRHLPLSKARDLQDEPCVRY